MQHGRLHVVGVRHHSPACARLVAHTIERLKPAVVLIEGPADMNDRLNELRLPHQLPIAVFSYLRARSGTDVDDAGTSPRAVGEHHASFSPFTATSPEWQALHAGTAVGADVRFMDLPAWDKAFAGVVNRYSDGARRHTEAVKQLCARFHIDGYDALWDHLFEGDCTSDDDFASLYERLDAYFVALRNNEPGGERDGPREAMMRAFIAAALSNIHDDQSVLVVCGGFHATALLVDAPTAPVRWPVVDKPVDAESYLVPWSFARLDAFSGYAAGMPSPGFYDDVFHDGASTAVQRALWSIVGALRDKGLSVSSADAIAAQTMAEGLARLRGHSTLRRTDLLDGVAAALVKEALERPLPWSGRGELYRDSDALLVQVLKVLSGQRRGVLAKGTPQPPLVADVNATLLSQGLMPATASCTHKLRLADAKDLARSRTLHRLRLLNVPGFARTRGPKHGGDGELEEVWVVSDHDDRLAAIIEAAAFGATLSGAVTSALSERMAAADMDLLGLADVLFDAVLVGLDALGTQALRAIRRHAGHESDLVRLGQALARVLGLYEHDALFGAQKRPELRVALDEIFERGLWLLEQVHGASSPADGRLVTAVVALRDTARTRHAANSAADNNRTALLAVCERCSANDDAPPAIRGAALGVQWSLGALTIARAPVGDDDNTAEDAGTQAAIAAVRRMAGPTVVGDFLAGLFAVARAEVSRGGAVIAAVDEVVAAMPEPDFLIALPALRLAFSFFPPREKVNVAEQVAAHHGASPAVGCQLLTLTVDADVTASGRAIDDAVQAVLVRYGLVQPHVQNEEQR
jgi:hypothetical protein